jgi:hypothetical protein
MVVVRRRSGPASSSLGAWRAVDRRPDKRSNLVKTALALIGVAVLGACSGSGSSHKALSATTTTLPEQATVAPTTTTTIALRPPVKVGVGALVAKGFTVQVLGYTAPAKPDDPAVKPPSGHEFAVVEVKACAGDQTAKAPGPAEFALKFADGSSVTPRVAVRKPVYLLTTLKPKECTQGFITFSVPAGARPSLVVLTTDGTTWSVS